MKYIVAGDLPSVREWIKTMLELRIKRVIDATEKRAETAVVPTLATAIFDPRKINQFRREGDDA